MALSCRKMRAQRRNNYVYETGILNLLADPVAAVAAKRTRNKISEGSYLGKNIGRTPWERLIPELENENPFSCVRIKVVPRVAIQRSMSH